MLRQFIFTACVAAGLFVIGCDQKSDQSSSTQGSATSGPTSKAAGGSGTLVVGFSQIGNENAWRTAETNSIQSEAKNRNIDLKFSDAQGKQENQIKALRAFVAEGVDAIILAPKVETGWEPVLKEIKQAKIPVILVDRGVTVSDDSLYTTLICSNFVDEGQRAGEWLAKKLNGKGNIVQLEGSPGAAPAIDRGTGFKDAISKYPDMKIIKSETGDFTLDKGKQVMEAFLKSEGKNINAVFSHNDDMALGAIQSIEAAGMQPGKDITIVSIDGIHDGLKAIADGKMNCTVECNPLLGPAAFDAVAAAHAGQSLPKKTIVKDALFDDANAKDALPSRKY